MAACFTAMGKTTPDYVCEFVDGTFAPVTVVATYGKRDMIGTATRRDGIVRVLFFSDPNGDGYFIPRDGDRWIHNIRCPWASFGSRRPVTAAVPAHEPPGARRIARHLAARLAAEDWPEAVRPETTTGRKSA